MKTEKINHIVNDSINGFWFGLSATISGLVIFLGKKLVDWLFDASVEKFEKKVDVIITKRIDIIIEQEIKPMRSEVKRYRDEHHGALRKNEGVLLESLHTLSEYHDFLQTKKKKIK